MATASKVKVDLQNGTDRTVYATWTWSKEHTKNYIVRWYYATGDGIWFLGEENTVTSKLSTYTAPSNANKAGISIKPVSTTYKKTTTTVNKKTKKKTKKTTDVNYWTADWSTKVWYTFSNNPPEVPSVPTVTVDGYKLTAEVNVYDSRTDSIEFQVVQNDNSPVTSGIAAKVTNHAAFSCNISPGIEYKVRCRGVRGNEKSAYSEYSANVTSMPITPSGFTSYRSTSSNSVRLEWSAVNSATSYTVEYTSKKEYFDTNPSGVKSETVSVTAAEIIGLDSGETWFRLRASNSQGDSGFCSPVSIILGKAPAAPTTWSSSTTAMVGDTVTLYWVHNSEDGSSQTYAELEITINGTKGTITIQNTTDEDLRDRISSYSLSVPRSEGSVIEWRVRTMGVLNKYGEWSVMRTITAYAPPTLSLNIPIDDGLQSYPIIVSATAGPSSQNALQFFVSIIANETYETTDFNGDSKIVTAGEEVYSINTAGDGNNLYLRIMPNDVNLDNNISYTIYIIASMDSGLSAEYTKLFTVEWIDEELSPDAEVVVDFESLVAYITPNCEGTVDSELLDSSGNNILDSQSRFITTLEFDVDVTRSVLFSVYRREYDGSYVEIMTNINGAINETVTDPHPSLDLARYRIVAVSKTTGAIGYYDIPGVPVNEVAAVIQWDEAWRKFDYSENIDDDDQPAWSGSMLWLPYNLDVSDDSDPDVVLVPYIGRNHPVSYYGTQRNKTATWNMEIEKDDRDTLYGLRRLANYAGDVYVREPSGSGYWANIKVSFSQKHKEVVIPVTLSITRVEGGA